MGTMLKVTLGVVLGGVLLIGGCVALIGAGVDDAQKESDKTAITDAEYTSVGRGDRRADVIDRFGEPQSADEIQTEDIKGLPKSGLDSDCIYYGRKGELLSLYQFCFENDRFQSKASY